MFIILGPLRFSLGPFGTTLLDSWKAYLHLRNPGLGISQMSTIDTQTNSVKCTIKYNLTNSVSIEVDFPFNS